MIEIKELDLLEGCQVILSHKLHYKTMSGIHKAILNNECKKIVIAYWLGDPVGAAMTCLSDGVECQVFVKKEYRRLGIGTMLVKALNIDVPNSIVDREGYKKKFWNVFLD